MADTAAPAAPSPIWDVLKASIPYLGQVLVLLATFGTGMIAQHVIAKPEKVAIPAADAPRPAPVPMVALSDLDHVLTPYGEKLDALRKMIDERIPAPAKVAPSKVKVWK